MLESLFLTKLQAFRPLLKSTPAQTFSCEIVEIFKNTYFYETTPVAASESPLSPMNYTS